MTVVQLASIADVKGALGRDLTTEETAKADAILDKASELFRVASAQQFTEGTSTVRLRVTSNYVVLPQRPVVSVDGVKHDANNGAAIPFELFKSRVTLDGVQAGQMVRVEYTHGGVVPDLVRLTIAELCKKVLAITPKAAAGITSAMEVTGPFTDQEVYASWSIGGQTMLAPSDEEIAKSFRVRVPGSIILGS